MKRVRITHRNHKAVDGSIPYPGNVNQPDRQFKTDDQYSNYQETLNHPTPDMRHEWQNDRRDEIGFGIPEAWKEEDVTVASVRVAANKSVKLAYLLLGNKVAEDVIEEQANDFMLLGPAALDRSLARFASTGDLYAEDEDEEEEEEEESKEASDESKKAEDEEEEEESKEASDDKKAEDEEEEEESKEASDESKKAEDEEEEEESKEASEEKTSVNDIELYAAADEGDVEPDERLAGIFDDDIPAELPDAGAGKRKASEKQGVKSLGGQPRVASDGGAAQDISSIWASAPDVSSIFN